VLVAAPPLSQDVVSGCGIEYAPLGDPPKTGGDGKKISTPGIAAFVSRTVFSFLRSLLSRGPGPTWPVKTPDLERLMDSSWAACEGADAVIFPFIMIWAYHIAEKLRIPCYLWDTHPLTPTRAFPHFQFTGIFPAWFRLANALPWFRRNGGFNLFTHRVVQRLLLSLGLRLTNRWRAEKLQLSMLRNIRPLLKFYNDGAVVLYGYSPLIVPKPDDWPAFHHVTGYWFLDKTVEWQPPSELLRFLSEGSPPVCIGFGSARDRNPQRLTKIAIDALARAGCRGILLTGRGGLVHMSDVPSNVFIMDFIPHDWLFSPRRGSRASLRRRNLRRRSSRRHPFNFGSLVGRHVFLGRLFAQARRQPALNSERKSLHRKISRCDPNGAERCVPARESHRYRSSDCGGGWRREGGAHI
jgi:hypothetical protein